MATTPVTEDVMVLMEGIASLLSFSHQCGFIIAAISHHTRRRPSLPHGAGRFEANTSAQAAARLSGAAGQSCWLPAQGPAGLSRPRHQSRIHKDHWMMKSKDGNSTGEFANRGPGAV
eukprot:g3367.t1